LARWRVIQSTNTTCAVGCGHLEMAKHLFLSCDTFSSLWLLLLHWLDISSVLAGELRHHFLQFINTAGLPRVTHLFLRIIWFAFVWVFWKERNNHVFKNAASNPSILLEKVKLNSYLWLKSKQVSFSNNYHDTWKHPLFCMGIH